MCTIIHEYTYLYACFMLIATAYYSSLMIAEDNKKSRDILPAFLFFFLLFIYSLLAMQPSSEVRLQTVQFLLTLLQTVQVSGKNHPY